ncbi:hypothetical protein, partial [Shewanella sairae]|uniref:hypothetical protein n=1 Tax=Shewanella sairae TaxID=190310 RepID=UPI001C7F8D98
MATLNDVVRHGQILITPMYFDVETVTYTRIDQAVENEADIELNGIESLTFIELIEANPSHLSLIEKDLQC